MQPGECHYPNLNFIIFLTCKSKADTLTNSLDLDSMPHNEVSHQVCTISYDKTMKKRKGCNNLESVACENIKWPMQSLLYM